MLKISELGKLPTIHKKVVKRTVNQIRKNIKSKDLWALIFSDFGSVYRYVIYVYLQNIWEVEPGLYVTLYGLPAFDGIAFGDYDIDDMINSTIGFWDDGWPDEINNLIKELEALYGE